MMIRGIGVDVCEISRMDNMNVDSRFVERYFSEDEKGFTVYKIENGVCKDRKIFLPKPEWEVFLTPESKVIANSLTLLKILVLIQSLIVSV